MLTLSAKPLLKSLQLILIFGLISSFLLAQETAEQPSEPSEVSETDTMEAPASMAEDAASDAMSAAESQTTVVRDTPAKVVVIPVRDQIAKPILYVIRRGLKDAIETEADLVVLDMETPGGSLGATFEILEALGKFDGETATYVNDEAISAGSFISAMTDDIYFAPTGVIGAAAPVMSGGGEIDESMKQKIVSYLKARIRAISEGHPYRGEVISAMIDADYELKIGDEVLKEKGELLSLTATEAAETYGEPPYPLLAAGIHESIEDLLIDRYGEGGFEITQLETTWSEELAAFLNGITPILLGLGLLGMFIEFKTPGFGIFGVGGGLLLLIVFFGHYTAGLSGHEPALFFVLGAVLVMVELLFLPGTIFIALAGLISMLGSIIWSMADLWPDEPISFSGDVFLGPIIDLMLGLLVAIVGGALLLRFLPKGWIWDKMVLASAGGQGRTSFSGVDRVASQGGDPELVGQIGEATSNLMPAGQVRIGDRWFEAKVEVGAVDAGQKVIVREQRDFGLIVEAVDEEDDV